MKNISINTEFITLGQLLKIVGLIDSGGAAKYFLATNTIYVNDELENRRGKKLYKNYKIKIKNEEYLIK